ncbi:hypothetical protein VPH35_037768 [Triticum aestivum]
MYASLCCLGLAAPMRGGDGRLLDDEEPLEDPHEQHPAAAPAVVLPRPAGPRRRPQHRCAPAPALPRLRLRVRQLVQPARRRRLLRARTGAPQRLQLLVEVLPQHVHLVLAVRAGSAHDRPFIRFSSPLPLGPSSGGRVRRRGLLLFHAVDGSAAHHGHHRCNGDAVAGKPERRGGEVGEGEKAVVVM